MTSLLPVLTVCSPRPPEQASQDYAADRRRALEAENGELGAVEPTADFFASAYPTAAMPRVTAGIFQRLKPGPAAPQPAPIRFNTMFGGGKTPTLSALAAAAKYPQLIRAKAVYQNIQRN